MRVHPVSHVSQLKLCRKPEDTMTTYQKPDPVITAVGQEEYEVEEVLYHRKRRRGRATKVEYLILWKGYPAYEMTQEPEENVNNAQEKIAEYYERIDGNAAPKGGQCSMLDSFTRISLILGQHMMAVWDSRIAR